MVKISDNAVTPGKIQFPLARSVSDSQTLFSLTNSSTGGVAQFNNTRPDAIMPVVSVNSLSQGPAGVFSVGTGVGFYTNFAALQTFNTTHSGVALSGEANTGSFSFGVYGQSIQGYAGYFTGKVLVTGFLYKGGGAFRIDHPLDPENKYLNHSFVESPDMKNIYDGIVVTDETGQAIVRLPEWFEALNKDFRYQLTVIGQFAQAIVAEEIRQNQFRIKTDKPNVKVCWQVTGIRHDAFAEQNRLQVEEDKAPYERGYYLHPAAFGLPDSAGMETAYQRARELLRRLPEGKRETEKAAKSGK